MKINTFNPNLFKNLFPELHSIIISHQNEEVFSAYYDGYHPAIKHEAQSITKSIQSLVLGNLMMEKKLNLNTLIEPFFKDYPEIVWDESKKQINVGHLLTHTTGLKWREQELPYSSWQNDANKLFNSSNWIKKILFRKVIWTPGEVFGYSSANPILLSLIISTVTGMSNQDYLKEYLFSPLNISNFDFDKQASPKGVELLGDANLFPKDLCKIGALVINRGKYQGKQVIPSQWIDQSLKEHIYVYENLYYGLGWWIKNITINQEKLKIIYAWGYGGQHIFMIEKLHLVVVITAGKYPLTHNLADEPFQILENHIIPEYL